MFLGNIFCLIVYSSNSQMLARHHNHLKGGHGKHVEIDMLALSLRERSRVDGGSRFKPPLFQTTAVSNLKHAAAT